MKTKSSKNSGEKRTPASSESNLRADAQRSVDALIQAAATLFATKGVEVTTREIASLAGVGMGTLYRRFARRADLVGAVFQSELDALAAASNTLARSCAPFEALAKWMQLYVKLLATKRGLAKAVSSDDPVYVGMAEQFARRLHPAARTLYEAAALAGEVRPELDAAEVMAAVGTLCMSTFDGKPDHAGRMVALFISGLRVPS